MVVSSLAYRTEVELTEYMLSKRVIAQEEQGGQWCTQAITHRTGLQFMEPECLRPASSSHIVSRALARYLIAREACEFQAANNALRKIGNHLDSRSSLISATHARILPTRLKAPLPVRTPLSKCSWDSVDENLDGSLFFANFLDDSQSNALSERVL